MSQSGGSLAPVIICQQCFAGRGWGSGAPAGWRPWIWSWWDDSSPARKAMPSMVTRSKGGEGRSAWRLS